jgi:GntR family transcriptional repressor for pyruvate dehydrogenase complex
MQPAMYLMIFYAKASKQVYVLAADVVDPLKLAGNTEEHMFKPVRTKKIYEEVVEQIKQLIVDGELQPGDKLLSERELSDKLNVSRASIREAFSALEIMGIITIRPGEGSFVRQVSFERMLEPLSFLLHVDVDDVIKLLEVRKILEVEIAALAAARATEEDIEDMRTALESMIDEVNNGEVGDKADAAFHFAILKAAHNPTLIKLMNAVSDLMTSTFHFSRQKIFMEGNMPKVLYDAHSLIFQAIVQKKPQQARKLMGKHLTMVEESLAQLKRGGVTSLRKQQDSTLTNNIKTDFGFPS